MGYNIFSDHQRGDTRELKTVERKCIIENQLMGACVYVLVFFFMANIFSMGLLLSSIQWHLALAIFVSFFYSIITAFTVMFMYAASFIDNMSDEKLEEAKGNR